MKQNYTMYIYKADRRKKSGERLVFTYVLEGRDDNGMRREVAELFEPYPPSKGYRFEWFPTTKTVKNLMTGADVVIAYDTPRSCDPSSELYWSM